MTSRKRGVVSYKEPNSDGREGEGGVSGDDVEGAEEGPPIEDNRETIERVLKKRMGPVEGTRLPSSSDLVMAAFSPHYCCNAYTEIATEFWGKF